MTQLQIPESVWKKTETEMWKRQGKKLRMSTPTTAPVRLTLHQLLQEGDDTIISAVSARSF